MLEATLSTMMIMLGICIFMQKSIARAIIAFIFAFITLSHNFYFHSFSNSLNAYYISAGVLSLVVILLISLMKESPRLAGDIQDIALVSIMFNGLGWVLFRGGAEPTAYMTLYALLYGWTIFILMRGEPRDVGNIRIDTRLFAFPPDICQRILFHYGKSEKK